MATKFFTFLLVVMVSVLLTLYSAYCWGYTILYVYENFLSNNWDLPVLTFTQAIGLGFVRGVLAHRIDHAAFIPTSGERERVSLEVVMAVIFNPWLFLFSAYLVKTVLC